MADPGRATAAGIALRRAAVAGLATALVAALAAAGRAAEPVLLQIKGEAGSTYSHDFQFTGKMVARTGTQKIGDSEQAAAMVIETKVVAVTANGRRTLEERLRTLELRMAQNGQTTLTFDSRKPDDVARARADRNFENLLASLESKAHIEQEPTGEVLAADVEVPGANANPARKSVASQFLLQAIGLTEYHFPPRPIPVGERWECASFETPIVGGAGAIVGTAQCTLTDVRTEGGERTAVVTFTRAGTLRQNPESATQARVLFFAEQGDLHLAIDRGRVRSLAMSGKTSIELTRAGKQNVTDSEQQLSLREHR